MPETNAVRPSRDGDQFHYTWAARRCLLLLSPCASLRAVTIEGASQSEAAAEDRITSGEELIDVGEYYGSENLEQATLIRYIQLKHSTLREYEAWTPSGLKRTLYGFARRYEDLQNKLNTEDLSSKVEFCFISNRPINSNFLEAIQDASEGIPARHGNDFKKLEKYTNLTGMKLKNFCKLLRLEGYQEGLWDQQNILAQDVAYYLVDADIDAPVQLKELVTKKALSVSSNNPSITKMDVLRALKTDESRLFPAPCLINNLENPVVREQESEILDKIVQASGEPIIIHAAGGVGKSVFATRIKLGLPPGSSCIIYDCFGNAQYRSTSGYRHRHKDALVQIANELAANGLCHPLVPTLHAEQSAYMKAFIYRLKQSITSLRSKNPSALLCITIDAADNAQMAAEEIGETRSFVRDLIREQLPEGVRLIALCRTHRQYYLDPPPSALRLELKAFSRTETALYLRQIFLDSSEQNVDEFHRLSSQNPRVQAIALSRKVPLNEILRALGPNPTTVDDAIGSLLDNAIAKLRDEVGIVEKKQIDKICTGLATLRPLIPISVLATISGVTEGAIKSFAFDLGRPLLVIGDTIQFFDEPAETWFRDRFRPTVSDLSGFVAILTPLTENSSYLAAALPQLMLEAGQFVELVELALSSQALPSTSPVEKRDIELQRLHFAIKASLRAKRYIDVAKLALKAGGECAGDERQRKLLQSNTDLAAVFLDTNRIQELISRKTFGSGWVGSHHAYEAAILSEQRDLIGDACSRLRMAREWLQNWSQLSPEKQQTENVSEDDILELATAIFNIHGANSCANELRSWRPREISFRVGRTLARRMIDHGRYDALDELASAAGNDLCLILAITIELREINKTPPKRVIERALKLALNTRISIKDSSRWDGDGNTIRAVTALVEAAFILAVSSTDALITLLTRYLPKSPPRGLSYRFCRERFALLRAYTLRAELNGQSINVSDLAHDELRKKLLDSAKSYSESQDIREFNGSIGSLLPWHQLWAATFVGRMSQVNLMETIAEIKALKEGSQAINYREEPDTFDEITRVWFDTLLISKSTDDVSIDIFEHWITKHNWSLPTPTLSHLARLAARSPSLEARAFDYARKAFDLIQYAREDSESKSDSYVELARSILPVSRSEAAAYFNQAVEVASKIGDENTDRWGAILDLADRAASTNVPNSMTAYRLARCAELTYEYVLRDKHFDWKSTIEAISGLCGKSALAILSRWRDRNFGNIERILPIAINFLVSRGDLDPKIAIALIGFRVQWNEPLLLNRAFVTCANNAELETATNLLYRYMALERHSNEKWRELYSVLEKNGIALPELSERISFSELEEQTSKSWENCYGLEGNENQEGPDRPDWNQIFDGFDLGCTNDISQSYRLLKNYEYSYRHERFFAEACRRVYLGKEAEFISAIADVPDFCLYDFRKFLEQIPEAWKQRLAFKSALAQTLKAICRRFCNEITKSRYYEVLPFKTACELSGIQEGDVLDVILNAIGEGSEVAGAGRMFALVGLITPKLTKSEALEALSFGLDLFNPILEETDGDGPWAPNLEPPAEIERSVAGYIWSCLAAPRTTLRWEAAHVVQDLCTLGHGKVLEHLIKFANGDSADAFYDARLHFYKHHACQWLLIGLSHAAKFRPDIVAQHFSFLSKLAFTGEPHVLIRQFAKRTILTLIDTGHLDAHSYLRPRLSDVNVSLLPPIESKYYQRFEIVDNDTDANACTEGDEDRFYFGYDVGSYWLKPLGRCFAIQQAGIEREVMRVIKNDWQLSRCNRFDEDERHRRKIFRDMETSHSHGLYPRVDDLRFYLSYHAMMVAAGKLLATTPVHFDPDDSSDEFQIWISSHDLSRDDCGWIADRRDPIPLERPAWKDNKETDDWRWSIVRNDFDRILIAPDGRMNLWGHWLWASGNREESIRICSALVSSDRSMSLLMALQSANNPHDFRIPDAEDDLQIDMGKFQLKGWIIDRNRDYGIDKQDPWAGNIKYPSFVPADYIIELMRLESDPEHRRWYIQGDNVDVAWSQVWGHVNEKYDGDKNHENGARFQASFPFVISLLRKINMDLIIEIEIERRNCYSQGTRNTDNDIGFISPSARLFLIRSSGSICTI